jgi:hypothetical protein
MRNAQKCSFQVDSRDNVATLLSDAEPGVIRITGEGPHDTVMLLEPIQRGYKVAITDLGADEPVVKYGRVIGRTTGVIRRGQAIHLHNCRSLVDHESEKQACLKRI